MTDGREDDGEPYKVGYGKPPREHQFQRGKPQNFERGRKASRPRAEMIHDLANEKVEITDNKRTRKITFDEASIRRLRLLALSGNLRAQALWSNTVEQAEKTLAVRVVRDTQREAEVEESARIFKAKIEEMAARYRANHPEPFKDSEHHPRDDETPTFK
jgi:hypothetical protein